MEQPIVEPAEHVEQVRSISAHPPAAPAPARLSSAREQRDQRLSVILHPWEPFSAPLSPCRVSVCRQRGGAMSHPARTTRDHRLQLVQLAAAIDAHETRHMPDWLVIGWRSLTWCGERRRLLRLVGDPLAGRGRTRPDLRPPRLRQRVEGGATSCSPDEGRVPVRRG